MVKQKARSGKAGSYGKSKKIGKTDDNKKGSKVVKPKKFKKMTEVKKSLVSKEIMEALKENRQQKKENRMKAQIKKVGEKGQKKRKFKETESNKKPKTKKELKKLRQAHDNVEYENIVLIKSLWEKARVNEIDPKKKSEIINQLKEVMTGKVESLMFKHDLARVIQMMLKHGKTEQNNFIVSELSSRFMDLAKSKYGKFTASSMLKHSTSAQRKVIFKSLSGHFKKLTLHSESVSVVDTFYNDYANSKQRTEIITEFYGKEFYLFRDILSEHLTKVLEVHPDKKDSLLENLLGLTNAFIEKGLTGYIIVQHLMLQYFLHASGEAIQELISDKLIEQLVNFVHTKEGSRITMRCIWHGKTKDRKAIIKTFKGHVKEMTINENGYLVLLSIFDCVDDTVLVKKMILTELLENIDLIIMSQFGRNVINYLLNPRGKQCHPIVTEMLKFGDGNNTSKKDTEVRRKELLGYVSSSIVENYAKNIESMLLDNQLSLLISIAVIYANSDKTPIYNSLVDLANNHGTDFIDSNTYHLVLKQILRNDTTKKEFSENLISNINSETFKSWMNTNRGTFSILRILEHKTADNQNLLVDVLKSWDLMGFKESAGRDKLISFLST